MEAVWSEQRRLELMLEIELLACEAMEELEQVPRGTAQRIRSQEVRLDPARVAAIEERTKHDINAFLDATAELVGADARVLHRGMTSSDVVDTAFAAQLQEAGTLVLSELQRSLGAVKALAQRFKDTPCMGRTHGVHAEPTTFGLKFAGWFAELKRREGHLRRALDGVSVGQVSGAVGSYAFVDPRVEAHVCRQLGLGVDPAPTQVISRDRHAEFFSALALLGASIERCAVEIRHLQRSEVQEAGEPFGKGQKGSSAMPHKKNPILSENLTGLARLLRSYAQAALENVALWHERDISHSSVERVIGPDATTVAHFMLRRFAGLVEGLVVNPERAQANIDSTGGAYFSQRVLLALVDSGVDRQRAYQMVQRNALAAWEAHRELEEQMREDGELVEAVGGEDSLASHFDAAIYSQHVDTIFGRVFGDGRVRGRVEVMPRTGVLDPQGKAIGNALRSLGFDGVDEVRAGKLFELELRDADADALEDMAQQLLANPVVEDHRVSLEGEV
jgi:adenylosuccinate lyase